MPSLAVEMLTENHPSLLGCYRVLYSDLDVFRMEDFFAFQ
jgi:hypothetical protein